MNRFYQNETILNGTYQIDKKIGQGAFGDVYLATYLRLGVQRAIKVVRKNEGVGSSEFAEYRDRFRLEAKLGATFHHSNIIHVDQFEEEGDSLFLIMDYAPGGSLADQIEKSRLNGVPIPVERAIEWVIEAAAGLSKLHENDMVHRDIKPSNILVDAEGEACIADLGLVQLPTSRMGGSSFGVNHPGTPEYMPPEQQPGNFMPVRASADVYGLGCVLFELLTNRQYYHRAAGTSARSLRGDIPQWLDKLVAKSLQADPNNRYPDANQFARALRGGVGETTSERTQPVSDADFPSSMEATDRGDAYTSSANNGSKPFRGSVGLWVGLAALTIALISIVIIVSKVGNNTPKPEVPTPLPVVITATVVEETKSMSPTATTGFVEASPNAVKKSGPVRVAYMIGGVGNSDIYIANEDGSDAHCVACKKSCDESEPSWSPDGENIVYQSNCNGTYDLWTVDVDGNNAQRLTTDGSDDEREPDWSIDNKILYRVSDEGSSRDDNGDIYELDYGQSSSGFPIGISGRSPAWSPDGKKISFMSNQTGIWQIYVLDTTTNSVNQITDCSVNCRWPMWSPDGKYIVYNRTTSKTSATAAGVAYISSSGGEEHILVTGDAGRPSWSSNGEIAFNVDKGIETIGFDSRSQTLIISDMAAWGPVWSN